MATLRLFGPATVLNERLIMDSQLYTFQTFVQGSDTFYRYISSTGNLVSVSGTDFVINGANRFVSGTVTSIAVNSGNTTSTDLFFTMPDLNIDGTTILGSGGFGVPTIDAFWQSLMDGPSSIVSVRGLGLIGGADGNRISGNTYLEGDDSTVRGEFSGNGSVAGSLLNASGNSVVNGGSMNFRGYAYQVAGDVNFSSNSATVKGGDDRLVITDFSAGDINGFSNAFVAGDIVSMFDTSVLVGGDDYIDARNVSSLSGTIFISGDVDNVGANTVVVGGNDLIAGSRTMDNVIAGDIRFNNAPSAFVGGDDTIYSFDGDDQLFGDIGDSSFDEMAGGDDTIFGGGGSDLIVGGGGRDVLFKDGGHGTIFGGAGTDFFRPTSDGIYVFDGGSGARDTVSYLHATDFRITVDLVNSANNTGSAIDDTLFDVENYLGSNISQDFVYGTSGANRIVTYGANDFVVGRGGGDFVSTGNGNDRINASTGANSYNGGAGFDLLSYQTSSAGVNIDLQNRTASGGDAQGDVIRQIEHIFGSELADVIAGDRAGNDLRGRGGEDRIYGRDGVDVLSGNTGNDRLFGGNGFDRLVGGDQDDYLEGGRDGDYLFGGDGFDVFHFNRGDGIDRIRDFQDNVDTIQIDGYNPAFNPLATATQNNGHVYIRLGGGDWIIVENTTVAALVNDFEVV